MSSTQVFLVMTTSIKGLSSLEEWQSEWDALSSEVKTFKVSFCGFCSLIYYLKVLIRSLVVRGIISTVFLYGYFTIFGILLHCLIPSCEIFINDGSLFAPKPDK